MRGVDLGVVEQPEVVGTADVQHVGVREQRPRRAVPAVRRPRPDQPVPDDVADRVPRRVVSVAATRR